MFEKFQNLFSSPPESKAADHKESLSKRIRIATAVILLEVANADDEFSQEEQCRIVDILKSDFSLDDESVHELLQISDERRNGSIDIWHFTNIINENYSDEEKLRVIENVWQVIYADGRLDSYEDYIVHKLSSLLHIPLKKMIEAKLKFLPDE